MLVLTRLKDQSIVIGDDINITIVDIDGERVRIGIDAPRSMRILRAEILQEVKKANLDSVRANKSLLEKMSTALLPQEANKTEDTCNKTNNLAKNEKTD